MDACRGFTLFELLIVASLLALLTAGGLAALSAGTRASEKAKRIDAMTGYAQVALESIAADLSAAVQRGEFCMVSLDAQREGRNTDTLDFLVAGLPKIDIMEGPYAGYCEIGYSIGNDTEDGARGLIRREDGAADNDPLEGGSMVAVEPYVTELNFEFYDGLEWVAGWTETKEFPAAIRIQIAVVDEDDLETPQQYSTSISFPIH